ncbi:Gamma-aminobutyric acid type B receptor subunit 1, partial [Caligus rogercresseyi]
YQWLIVGMYSEEWWSREANSTSCTAEEILIALKGTMVMEIQPLSSVDDITISKL